nr:MAG TPA: hypothetical protein [Caudoviricetes sp.]
MISVSRVQWIDFSEYRFNKLDRVQWIRFNEIDLI